jgi:hypothetical protein
VTPVSAPDGKSEFVNLMSAEIPVGADALSASLIAVASGSAGGVELVEPVAAIASTAVAPRAATSPPIKATSRVVERVRRNLTVILSLAVMPTF